MRRAGELWATSDHVLARVRALFEKDFREEIRDHEDYRRWADAIDRLFGYVGAIAAFLAELRLESVLKPSDSVDLADIRQAILIVRVICPQQDPETLRFRLCRSHFGATAEMVSELRALFGRLQAVYRSTA